MYELLKLETWGQEKFLCISIDLKGINMAFYIKIQNLNFISDKNEERTSLPVSILKKRKLSR